MPSFRQQLETTERWQRFPGLERLDAGLALTFDDGPDPDATPAVLEALGAAGARATAEALPTVLEAVAAAGLELVTVGGRDS